MIHLMIDLKELIFHKMINKKLILFGFFSSFSLLNIAYDWKNFYFFSNKKLKNSKIKSDF